MKAETEIWQVQTHDGLYQTDLPTLKQWVAEGLVLPTDRVRKGALKWIEAGRAPMLRRVFSGEERVETAAQQEAHAAFGAQQARAGHAPQTAPDLGLAADGPPPRSDAANSSGFASAASAESQWDEPFLSGAPSLSSACHFHPLAAATLVCRTCSATFCRSCPNKIGTSSVLLCTLCGGFCDPLEILTERLALYERQGEGFGLQDFGTALRYPFSHLASLIGGALLYAFLLLAGMRAQLLAWALVYGCISLVVRRVAYGNLKRDFLPDFGEFSFWDDVIVPAALGLGVTIVTLGPALLLVGALLFGLLGGAQPPQASPQAVAALAAAEQQQKKEGVRQEEIGVLTGGGTKEQEPELEKKINGLRPGAQMAHQLEESKQDKRNAYAFVGGLLLAHPGLFLLLALAALGWAVFYHPMALLVAGWTESLKSVLNPLVGLDTIRHMGFTYFKAFLMYLVVQVAALVLTFIVGLLTAPFDLPLVGNLVGTFLSGVVTFYTSLVIACVLGLALFKSADRLGIELD